MSLVDVNGKPMGSPEQIEADVARMKALIEKSLALFTAENVTPDEAPLLLVNLAQHWLVGFVWPEADQRAGFLMQNLMAAIGGILKQQQENWRIERRIAATLDANKQGTTA